VAWHLSLPLINSFNKTETEIRIQHMLPGDCFYLQREFAGKILLMKQIDFGFKVFVGQD